MPNKTYSPKIITAAISAYNLGNTLEESAKIVNRRFKTKLSKNSVHAWVNEFKGLCAYSRIREDILKIYGANTLIGKTFEHSGLKYDFQYHVPKIEILCNNGFSQLAGYVKGFESGCPDYFNKIKNQCSEASAEIQVKTQRTHNLACSLASFALKAAERNAERHKLVEQFMLINDSSTVACEVPVWFWEKNLNAGISGHVDILQVRNGLIYILDFKPEAAKEDGQEIASQLFLYASGLSFRTGIKLENFRCAWFDDKDYFEFSPKHANIRFRNSQSWKDRIFSRF